MNASLKPLALLLTATLANSQFAWAGVPGSRISEDVTVSPGRAISRADEVALSRAAARVLDRIGAARTALSRQDEAAARDLLGQAGTLLDIVNAELPTANVRDQIRLADSKLKYDQTDQVRPDLVPLDAALSEVEDFARAPAGHAQGDKAGDADRPDSRASAGKDIEVVDAALMYEETDLPLATTRTFIQSALGALAKHDVKRADLLLRAAQDHVVTSSMVVDEPLVPARANLARAHANTKAGRLDAARADLGRAIGQLDRAAQRAEGSAGTDVRALLDDARALDRRLDQGGQAGEREFAMLWKRAHALADRAMDYTDVGWARLRAGGTLKQSLIEAKLQARYADADAFVGGNTMKAQNDLGEAQRYLEQARDVKEIAPETAQRIDALRQQLAAIRAPGKPIDRDALRALTQDISQTIQSL
jgi:hypothetical protein